jgi:hypothetical protein
MGIILIMRWKLASLVMHQVSVTCLLMFTGAQHHSSSIPATSASQSLIMSVIEQTQTEGHVHLSMCQVKTGKTEKFSEF